MDNLAYNDDDCYAYELHDGVIVEMFAQPITNHYHASHNICRIFEDYFDACNKHRKCSVFEDRVKLTLSEQTIFVPDVMVVCDPNKIKWNGVFGTPDLVVEVLSPSTFRYDLGFKKETYGRFGVKEYWIVDVRRKSIEIYLNKDGKLELENTFILFPAAELAELKEEEIARIPTEFTVPTFPELRVSLERVFSRMIE